MYYNIETMSHKSLEALFGVLQDVRIEYEIKGINPFLYVLEDFDHGDKKYHIRVLRNLSKRGEVHINMFWFISSSSFLQYIKVKINDSFFDFYDVVEKKVNADDKNVKSQIVSKGYEKWKDITLSFIGEQQVKIIHKDIEKVITFEEFGFADTRTANTEDIKAKSSWDLLKLFATQEGKLELNILPTDNKKILQKQKQELVKILRDYFAIKEIPISYNKDENSYITNFKIMLPEEFKEDYRDKDISDQF